MWEFFFEVDFVVTKSRSGVLSTQFIPSAPMVVQTRSDSAPSSPEDDDDNIYTSDRAVSPVEASASDSDMLIEKPLSGRRTKRCVIFDH